MNKLSLFISIFAIIIITGCIDKSDSKSIITNNSTYFFPCDSHEKTYIAKKHDINNKFLCYLNNSPSSEWLYKNTNKYNINSREYLNVNLEPNIGENLKYVKKYNNYSILNIISNSKTNNITERDYNYGMYSKFSFDPNFNFGVNPDFNFDPSFKFGINPDFNFDPNFNFGINPGFNLVPNFNFGENKDFSFYYGFGRDLTEKPNLIPYDLYIYILKSSIEINKDLNLRMKVIENEIIKTHNNDKEKTPESFMEDSEYLFYSLVFIYAFFTFHLTIIIKRYCSKFKNKKLTLLNKLKEIKKIMFSNELSYDDYLLLRNIKEEVEYELHSITTELKSEKRITFIAISIMKFQKNIIPAMALSVTFIYYFSFAVLSNFSNKLSNPITFDLLFNSTMPPIIATAIGSFMMVYFILLTVSVAIKNDHSFIDNHME